MGVRIEIDPIRCDAHGLCAELLPERISLDDWGYPLVDGPPLEGALEELARHAARACPTLAIKLRAGPAVDRRVSRTSPRPDVEQRDQRRRQDQAVR